MDIAEAFAPPRSPTATSLYSELKDFNFAWPRCLLLPSVQENNSKKKGIESLASKSGIKVTDVNITLSSPIFKTEENHILPIVWL